MSGRSSTRCDWTSFEDLDPNAPGFVVAVLRDGKIAAWRSCGAATPGGVPLRCDTPIYVASIAKQFTGAIIALLVLRGHVRLTDRVRHWLPELNASWEPVRLHHLLEHTAGGPDANGVDEELGFGPSSAVSTCARVAAIARTRLEHRPGTVHRYCNHGYVLLAAIVERVTGRCLGDVVADELFAPLRMRSSGFLDTAHEAPVPGWIDGTVPVTISFRCVGDGGLVTTVDDVARWDAWLPSSPLAPMVLDRRRVLPTGFVLHDTWGISIRTHRGLRIESHGGAIDGYLASYVRIPRAGVTIVALGNTDQGGPGALGRRLVRLADSMLDGLATRSALPWTETHGLPVPDLRLEPAA